MLKPAPERPWMIWRTGTEHLTITEAHPWHQPLGSLLDHHGAGYYQIAYDDHCPRCRCDSDEKEKPHA